MASVQQKLNDGFYKNELPYSQDTKQEWLKRDAELFSKFWDDVETEFNASQYNPVKWSKLTALAWEHGHASGLGEVLYWVEELIELIFSD